MGTQFQISLTDTLQFTWTVATEYTADPHRCIVVSPIGVTQVIDFTILKQFGSAIAVKTVVGVISTRNITISDTLTFQESTTFYEDSYHFVNPAIQVQQDALTPAVTVSFTCGASSLTLRAPNFGDGDSYDAFRINVQSRGGGLIVFQDPMWPQTEILKLQFTYLNSTDIGNVFTFLIASLGKQVTYVDHLGRSWLGIITSPMQSLVQESRASAKLAIDFQGVLQ